MEIKFVKVNPVQNMTILVFSRHPRMQYGEIARRLMAYESLNAEQVGFVEPAENPRAATRLHMMGGEFCANATRSLACVLAWKKKNPPDSREIFLIEASGAEELLECVVTAGENSFICKIKLPLPEIITEAVLDPSEGFPKKLPLVRLGGICHYILDEDKFPGLRDSLPEILLKPGFTETIINDSHIEAMGIMFYSPGKSFLTPLVYVKGSNSRIWESSCGSGSAAIGAFICQSTGRDKVVHLSQPGGTMTVSATFSHDALAELWLESALSISASGTAYI